MSWQTMANELAGQAPVNYLFALTLVNRAWKDLQRRFQWSFLWGDAAIATISPVGAGTVTTVLGQNTVVGDATARAAWAAIGLVTPIATLQFRIGTGTIYNIIGYQDNVPAGSATITLDRIFVDPGAGAGKGYQIYQVYLNAPTIDFTWWNSLLDPVTGYKFSLNKTRGWVDARDPQRLQISIPAAVIPYQINPQVGTFFQFPMYEMWPAPSGLTYVGTYYRSGVGFQAVTDTIPSPLDEDVVMEIAKEYAYEWCEANKDKLMRDQRGGDFRFLMGQSQKKAERLVNDFILKDEMFSRRHIIDRSEMVEASQLPWVSQRLMQATF